VTALVSVLFNEPKLLKCGWTLDNTSDAAVSVLFNEPKLLKFNPTAGFGLQRQRFSALQRAEIAEIADACNAPGKLLTSFSALQRAEIAEIVFGNAAFSNEPGGFSALQRAEIAEIKPGGWLVRDGQCFSALQRAEIAEIFGALEISVTRVVCFSALQRAEIAEICSTPPTRARRGTVSVLFNEPKLLK